MNGNGTVAKQSASQKRNRSTAKSSVHRCPGTVFVKNISGKKVKKQCGNELDSTAIFCPVCGKATNALKEELSGSKTFKQAWSEKGEIVKANFPGSIIFFLIPALAAVWALTMGADQYWLVNLIMLFIAPLAMLPFGRLDITQPAEPEELGSIWKLYPGYWLFTLLNIAFFMLIKILCTGFLLGVVTDPLLHFARLILVLHWVTIMLPAPKLMAEQKVNAFAVIKKCYVASAETRWQQFYLVLVLGALNMAGLLLAGIGALFTLPVTVLVISEYYKRLDNFKLFS